MGYSPRGHKELDTTERLTHPFCLFVFLLAFRIFSFLFLNFSIMCRFFFLLFGTLHVFPILVLLSFKKSGRFIYIRSSNIYPSFKIFFSFCDLYYLDFSTSVSILYTH